MTSAGTRPRRLVGGCRSHESDRQTLPAADRKQRPGRVSTTWTSARATIDLMATPHARNRGGLGGPTGQIVTAHRQEMADVLARHGVTSARIFGSVARGDDREGSDLDLLVDFAPDTSLLDIVGIQLQLEDLLGVSVDLLPSRGLKERVRASAEHDLVDCEWFGLRPPV